MRDLFVELPFFTSHFTPSAVFLISFVLITTVISSTPFYNMLRRLSTRFGSKKEADAEVNGVNGTKGANGVNGYSEKPKPAQKKSSFGVTNGTIAEHEDKSHERKGIADTFDAFAQLIHASQRPLPTQTGDGSYVEHQEHSGLWKDLTSMGIKDAKTLKEVLANKASGKLTDDKTMIMERVIQVCA